MSELYTLNLDHEVILLDQYSEQIHHEQYKTAEITEDTNSLLN